MVPCQTPEPSTITPQITDGPISRPEPSTLEAGITDGPIPQDRTFHAGDPYRGWSNAKHRTFHAEYPYRGWFDVQNGTFDAGCRRSWTVQGYRHSNSAHSSNSRQASGPFPEPGAVLTVCSRRRRFIPAAVPPLALAEN